MKRTIAVSLTAAALVAVLAIPKPDDHHNGKRSTHWPVVRAEHLKKFPTCAACGGKDSLQVHHVKPFRVYPDLELAPENLITLCEKQGHNCHFVVGHGFDFTGWNPHVREDAATILLRAKESHELSKKYPVSSHSP